jgi:hypothetical protein
MPRGAAPSSVRCPPPAPGAAEDSLLASIEANGEHHPMSRRPASTGESPRRPGDLEQLWEALLHTGWQCLAVIPVDPTAASQLVLDALRAVLRREGRSSIDVLDGRGASIQDGNRLAGDASTMVSKGRRIVAFIDPITRSLAGVPLVREADSALLLVQVGFPDVDSLASTLSIVGVDRVVGSVTVPATG